MKALHLSFRGSLGKTHSLNLKYINENLDEATVREAMNQIAGIDMFDKEGEKIYVDPTAAKYSETIVTPIFNDSKKALKA